MLLQIAQIIPITFFLIIVRTTMLRFNDRTGQWMPTRVEMSDLTVVHIAQMTVVDFDAAKESENSSVQVNVIEDIHLSKSHDGPEHEQNFTV